MRSVPRWVTDVAHDYSYGIYQRPLATEWKMHSGELEDRREQLEVDWSHPREMTRVYSPVRQREE